MADNKLENYDVTGDGHISTEDVAAITGIKNVEMAERKQRTQRKLAWAAMWAMIIATVVLFSPLVSDERVNALGDPISLFYIAMAGVVGAFMGMTAYMSK